MIGFVIRPLRGRDSTETDREAAMYIDPTAGSLVLQVLAAAALSAVAMVGRVREGVKSFFKSFTKR
jgi:hypothetical protein